jgi:hypothetical protein
MKPLLAILLFAVSARTQPRAINDAEREAVVMVASFLDRGPEALYERLSPDAPFRVLPRDQALRELAARTGPHAGTRWSLQTASRDVAFHVTYPSGYDDGLLFRMKRSGNRWMLYDVLTLAESRGVATPAEPRDAWSKPLLIAALLLAGLAIVAWWKSRVLSVIAFLATACGVVLAHLTPAVSKPPPPFPELRALVPLREALARGDELALPRNLSPAARDVASLWILASGAALSVPGNAGDPLAGLHSAKHTPLAEIMRARLALAKDDRKAAQQAFGRALAIPPLRDDIAVEAATSNFFVNDPRFSNSRDARWHYARRDLATAWRLQPVPREELVRDPDLLPLLHDPGVLSMVSYYGAEEPAPRSPSLGKSPIALPPRSKAFTCGELLRIELGDAILEVPGGASLAPRDARVVPATQWKQQDDAAALRDAATLLDALRESGLRGGGGAPSREPAGSKPAQRPAGSRPHGGQTHGNGNRVRVLRAAEVLARHNRWRELLTLTDSVPVSNSPELLLPRIGALLRANRADDARALAEQVTPRTPGARLAVGDAMTNIGAWDLAARLYGSIDAKERQQQLALRRELATNGVPIATLHFDIRHDPAMNPAIAARIGDLLEAELVRLQQKLPPLAPGTLPRRVTVNVVYWDAFRAGTGSDHILGLYTGEILFPFAVVNRFKPELVAIITHELTHALVAQATGDNAPRWFQEAVAQRFELVPVQENVFHDRAPESVLPVPLLDAVMDEATDEDTYRIALTFLRFLESRYGETSIAKLIASFAEGRNSDEALLVLTGKSLDALNRDFRAWGFANSANFTSDERFPYGALYSPGVDPRIKAGFRFGGRGSL